jgi:capsular exopolysaccharide synthesis family protein
MVKKIGISSLYRWWTPSPGKSAGDSDILNIGKKDTLFADRFKGLRAKFEQKTDILNFRVVGVTSSIAGEGKTLASAFLANSLALTGRHKVLLVDTDIRKADLTRGLSIPRSPGLTEHLLGYATLKDIVRDSHVPGLKLIAAGAEVKSPADLLAGDAVRVFLKEVRERYDIVLFDTPPVLAVSDTVTLRDRLDAFVFIFRASYTPVSMFRQAVEEIGEKKILGVVVNAVEPQTKKYADKYYGTYYSQQPPNAESAA